MRYKSLAKINLGLDVIRKREDGYHEVRMIMQTIHMYDQLDIVKSKKQRIALTTNLPYIPTNENNLVSKAIRLLMDEFHITGGVSVRLYKYIPVAAGLGGGSSDAAAAMIAMNRLFRLGLTEKELMERGSAIGADVPYCIMGGTALAEGIGEVLTPLPPMPKCYILLGKPGFSVSTRAVYENLKLDQLTRRPDIDRMIAGLREQDIHKIADSMGNVLETVTINRHPVIDKIKSQMLGNGALGTLMSGSGPTVFGIFDEEKKARNACIRLKRSRLVRQVFLTTPYNDGGKYE